MWKIKRKILISPNLKLWLHLTAHLNRLSSRRHFLAWISVLIFLKSLMNTYIGDRQVLNTHNGVTLGQLHSVSLRSLVRDRYLMLCIFFDLHQCLMGGQALRIISLLQSKVLNVTVQRHMLRQLFHLRVDDLSHRISVSCVWDIFHRASSSDALFSLKVGFAVYFWHELKFG